MKTRKLKDLTVSEIKIGCMGFSNGYRKIPSEEYDSIKVHRQRSDLHALTEFID